MKFYALFFLLALVSVVSGHARIKSPRPLDATIDTADGNSYNSPLNPDGSDFPCKGLHKQAGVDKTPTETWAAGSPASFEILGHGDGGGEGALAAHSGGSCQASLSFDDGDTWKVVHSYEGGCPRDVPLNSNMAGLNQVFDFDVPEETKAGDALFAWTWIAVTGNRDEFYMNCASVAITGSGTSTLADYPDMFVGDMDVPNQIAAGECRSFAGNALLYPDPGTQVTKKQVTGIPFKAPTSGNCISPNSAESPGTDTPDLPPSSTEAPPSSVRSSTYVPITTSAPLVKPTSTRAGRPSSSSLDSPDIPLEPTSSFFEIAPPSSSDPGPRPTSQGDNTKVAPTGVSSGFSRTRTRTRGRGRFSSSAPPPAEPDNTGYPVYSQSSIAAPAAPENTDYPVYSQSSIAAPAAPENTDYPVYSQSTVPVTGPAPTNTGYPAYEQPTTLLTLTTPAAPAAQSSEIEGSVGATDDMAPTPTTSCSKTTSVGV